MCSCQLSLLFFFLFQWGHVICYTGTVPPIRYPNLEWVEPCKWLYLCCTALKRAYGLSWCSMSSSFGEIVLCQETREVSATRAVGFVTIPSSPSRLAPHTQAANASNCFSLLGAGSATASCPVKERGNVFSRLTAKNFYTCVLFVFLTVGKCCCCAVTNTPWIPLLCLLHTPIPG